MSLELSKSGMGSNISGKFGESLPMGSMISSEEERKKNSSDYNRVLGCLAAQTLMSVILSDRTIQSYVTASHTASH